MNSIICNTQMDNIDINELVHAMVLMSHDRNRADIILINSTILWRLTAHRHNPVCLRVTCRDDAYIDLLRWQTAGLSSPPNFFEADDEDSPLGLAVYTGQMQIVRHLLGLGVNPNCKVNHLWVCSNALFHRRQGYDCPIEYAKPEIRALLIDAGAVPLPPRNV